MLFFKSEEFKLSSIFDTIGKYNLASLTSGLGVSEIANLVNSLANKKQEEELKDKDREYYDLLAELSSLISNKARIDFHKEVRLIAKKHSKRAFKQLNGKPFGVNGKLKKDATKDQVEEILLKVKLLAGKEG